MIVACVVLAGLGTAAGIGIPYVMNTNHSLAKADTEVSQLQEQITNLKGKEHSDIGNVLGEVNPLLSLAAFNGTCSTDLTGPQGPAIYYFTCTSEKPTSSSSSSG